eukprot:scaffold163802_cov21-Tisochrysis_lutea.AAC.1
MKPSSYSLAAHTRQEQDEQVLIRVTQKTDIDEVHSHTQQRKPFFDKSWCEKKMTGPYSER